MEVVRLSALRTGQESKYDRKDYGSIGNRTRDLSAFSAVHQPTEALRTPGKIWSAIKRHADSPSTSWATGTGLAPSAILSGFS
jgi:hypothetical protein